MQKYSHFVREKPKAKNTSARDKQRDKYFLFQINLAASDQAKNWTLNHFYSLVIVAICTQIAETEFKEFL